MIDLLSKDEVVQLTDDSLQTLRVGAILGAEEFTKRLKSAADDAGTPIDVDDVDRLLFEVEAAVMSGPLIERLTVADLIGLAEAIDDCIAQLGEKQDELYARALGILLGQQGSEPGSARQLLAGENPVAGIVRVFFRGAFLLALLAKLEVDASPEGLRVQIHPGIPTGVVEVVDRIAAVTGAVAPGIGSVPAPSQPGAGNVPPRSGTDMTEDRPRVPAVLRNGETEIERVERSIVALRDAIVSETSALEAALEFRRALEAWFTTPDWTSRRSDAFFGKSNGIRRNDEHWARLGDASDDIAVGVGFTARPPAAGADHRIIRPTIRLQSQRMLKPSILGRLAQWLKDRGFPDPVVRWTTPVVMLATNPSGNFKSWRGPFDGRLHIGSPLNIEGGSVGSVTLPLRSDDGSWYVLTAGHVLRDDARGRVGTDVFSPPVGMPTGADPCGRVSELSVPTAPTNLPGERGRPDYGLVAVDAGNLPVSNDRWNLRGFRITTSRLGPIGTERDPIENGRRVRKVAAKTRLAAGKVTAFNQTLTAWDPINARSVLLSGLVEVELDKGETLDGGDSGALICIEEGADTLPLAMLVCGARLGKVEGTEKPGSAVMYGQPLAALPVLKSLRLA